MATAIRQFKDSSNVLHDLDNRYIELSAASGTITSDQLAVLQESNKNYIKYSDGGFLTLIFEDATYLYYARNTAGSSSKYYIRITKSSGAYTYSTYSWSDTKNTAGSTDTSSKIFLVGATSQAANPQTYSDNQVYATDGQLDANKVRIAEAVTMVYDSTNKCINFNFA